MMGSIYGLVAVGLTIIFGIMRVINFAQGSLLMVGMFTTYWLWVGVGINPYLTLPVVATVAFGLGYLIQRYLLNHLLRSETDREPLSALILTMGLWLALDNLALLVFGPQYRVAQTAEPRLMLGFLTVSLPRLIAFLLSTSGVVGLTLFLKYSRIGTQMRAVGQDRRTAVLMGVDSYQIYAVAFGIGASITAVGGGLLVPFHYVYPTVGVLYSVRTFVVVVLGGMGSVPGALLGGILIGLMDSIGAQFIKASWVTVFIDLVFLVVLFVKPSGLMGVEKE
jgi:branched-chain amino acid transport system permease protein